MKGLGVCSAGYARTGSRRAVRIDTATASDSTKVGLREEPDHLLVLRLARDGSVSEVYNGFGAPAWEAAGKMQRNGQRMISFSKLRAIEAKSDTSSRIVPRNHVLRWEQTK